MTDDVLAGWVAERVAEGQTPEQIYLELLGQGHSVAAIQRAFGAAHRSNRSADLQQRVVRIVLMIGAVLVGAGIFSFVAANWQAMSDALRIGIIVVTVVGFSVAGWLVRERADYTWTGNVLLLIGSVAFGAGIFLVAQIYNVQGNWPDGFALWMAGTLAMAAATRTNLLYLLGLAVGIVAAVAYPVGLMFEGGLDPYLLSSPVLLVVAAAVAIAAGVFVRRGLDAGPRDRW